MRASARTIIAGGGLLALIGILFDVVAITTMGLLAVGIGLLVLVTLH